MTTRVALPLILLALALTACDDSNGGDRNRDDRIPKVMADLRWDVDDVLAESDTCGTWVVRSDLDEPLQIVDVAEDRVILPKVAPPADSELDPGRGWTMSGGCVETEGGPVVVVETQEPFFDFKNAPPKLVAGFSPEGEQLWVRELAGTFLGGYQGRGSVVFDELAKDAAGWLVVDARTGETVAEGEGETREPTIAVARDLAITVSDGVVPLPDGPSRFPEGTVSQVDGEKLLVTSGLEVKLVDLADGATAWTYPDASVLSLWGDSTDLSTGIVVARSSDGAILGVDFESGERRWTSEVPSADVNGVDSAIGSGVLIVKESGNLDQQVLIDTSTGKRLPDADGFVVVGQEILLLVDDEGVPRKITVDDLK